MKDSDYMRLALELAQRGQGWTAPNPMVGAVIVKEGRIIGQGWHARCGALHAERHALQNCTESPQGAVLYVTLEPCCHHGRQPPCTEAILASGIARVVVGSGDGQWAIPLDGTSSFEEFDDLMVLFTPKNAILAMPMRAMEPAVIADIQGMLIAGCIPEKR